ncbi:hypothetical protein QCA50_006493 [Cerrena zonata]|uniref:Uncharacterized protein n=1 Tax=Cerrena zonata TaxID=2478898 RepID=A0AAW0GEY7_9APHY
MVAISYYVLTAQATCPEPLPTSSMLVAVENSNNASSPTPVGTIVAGAVVFGVLLLGLAFRSFIKLQHQGRIGFLPRFRSAGANESLTATPGNVIANPSSVTSTNDTMLYPVASTHGGVNAAE